MLVEPTNAGLADALIERGDLTREELLERVTVQNVGDLERAVRGGFGLLLVLLASRTPGVVRWPYSSRWCLCGADGPHRMVSVLLGGPRDVTRRTRGSTDRIRPPRVGREPIGAVPMNPAPAFDLLASARHGDPFSVLGPHVLDAGVVIRTFQPAAERVAVSRGDQVTEMTRVHPSGIFEARFPGVDGFFDYRLRIIYPGGFTSRDRRSVPLRPRADRLRSASVRRRDAHRASSTSSARTASTVGRRPACTSRCGRPTPIASA